MVKEDATVFCDRRLVAKQEVQNRQPGLTRMNPLNRLAKLHLVADEHDVTCGGCPPSRNARRFNGLIG